LPRRGKTAMALAMLKFRVEIPGNDLILLGDAQGIKRLLSILLENATKYTPPGGWVTLCATATREHADISVRDSGIGIDPEFKGRIFDRFFRVATGGPSRAGSGLGLSLAKWIAERHGTQLCVESTPGHGSCFSFSLKKSNTALPAIHDSPVPSGLGIKL
jgi:signal transduction histidine kinase